MISINMRFFVFVLCRKVFSKLSFHVPEETVKRIVVCAPGVIEPVMCFLRERIEEKPVEHTAGDTLLVCVCVCARVRVCVCVCVHACVSVCPETCTVWHNL